MRCTSARLAPLLVGFALVFGAACAPSTSPAATEPAGARAAARPAGKPAAPADAGSFRGQTGRGVVPYTPGGAADIMMRQFAPTFAKYLPGTPTVIVENKPGAGGVVGERWVYELAPRDGTVIGQFSTVFADVLFTPEEAPLDLAKLQWLGSVSETQVTF